MRTCFEVMFAKRLNIYPIAFLHILLWIGGMFFFDLRQVWLTISIINFLLISTLSSRASEAINLFYQVFELESALQLFKTLFLYLVLFTQMLIFLAIVSNNAMQIVFAELVAIYGFTIFFILWLNGLARLWVNMTQLIYLLTFIFFLASENQAVLISIFIILFLILPMVLQARKYINDSNIRY
jgi:hypothetical protein